MSNNFDGPFLLTDGVGTNTVAATGYFGFGRAATGTQSTGPRKYAGTGNPNGTITAPRGSTWQQSDGTGFFINSDGGTTWGAV